MSATGWVRASKGNPCVCGHGDWCLVGDRDYWCFRIESQRPMTTKDGVPGWLHHRGDAPKPVRQWKPEPPAPAINCSKLMERWMDETEPRMLQEESRRLGVSAAAMMDYRWSWAREHAAWSVPMVDGDGELVGFRLRRSDGRKFSVKGGHEGLFLPWTKPERTAYIVEGASDSVAAATLGLYAIGRPSCGGGLHAIVRTIRRLGIEKCVVLPDDDSLQESERGRNPGLAGGELLSRHLPVPHCILVLPVKDMRDFIRLGGDSETLQCLVNQLVWRNPVRA